MPAILGQAQGWCGGHWRQSQAGGAQYYFPWERCDVTRLLYHSGLPRIEDAYVYYPEIPSKTHNFNDEWVYGRHNNIARTLKGSVATVHKGYPDDTVVTETFDAAGGLSQTWMFFHRLYYLWHNQPDRENNEYLIWRPLDRTFKAYEVEIIEITVGGSVDEFDTQFAGRIRKMPENWMVQPVVMKLKLVREVPPQLTAFMQGGSITQETPAIPGN